jgi:hypothetical protein
MPDVTLPAGTYEAADAAFESFLSIPGVDYPRDELETALLAAAPLIRADERDRIRQLADRNGAVCTGDEGTSCFFSELIREDPRA